MITFPAHITRCVSFRPYLLSPISYLQILSAFCLLFPGCHRGPATADELMRTLPKQFRGDLVVPGSPAHRLVVEPHEFTVRNPHLLEFNRVRYQVVAGSEVAFDGDAGIRGTISTPDLEISVEQVVGTADAAGSDVMKPDTFKGHLSGDLGTLECEWQSGLGQQCKFKAKAAQ